MGVSSSDSYEIEIINWEKYNPRPDRKKHSWFRINNNFFNDPKFADVNSSQLLVCICLYALASEMSTGCYTVQTKVIQRWTRLRTRLCRDALLYLEEKQVLKIISGNRSGAYERTIRTNDTIRTVPMVVQAPTLEPPKKPKKAPGIVSELRKLRFEMHNQIHGVAPEDNASTNGMLSNLVKFVGAEEAPLVLKYFYLTPNNFYRTKGHDLKLLLSDRSKLLTEVRRQAPIVPDARAASVKSALNNHALREELLRRARENGDTQ